MNVALGSSLADGTRRFGPARTRQRNQRGKWDTFRQYAEPCKTEERFAHARRAAAIQSAGENHERQARKTGRVRLESAGALGRIIYVLPRDGWHGWHALVRNALVHFTGRLQVVLQSRKRICRERADSSNLSVFCFLLKFCNDLFVVFDHVLCVGAVKGRGPDSFETWPAPFPSY
jgi:hypothetical protein